MYNIRNGDSVANINLYESHTSPLFASSIGIAFQKVYILYISRTCDIENTGQDLRCTTFVMAPFHGKYTTSYLIAIVMFALNHM